LLRFNFPFSRHHHSTAGKAGDKQRNGEQKIEWCKVLDLC
jgi:hypothetical protein